MERQTAMPRATQHAALHGNPRPAPAHVPQDEEASPPAAEGPHALQNVPAARALESYRQIPHRALAQGEQRGTG
eukprot:4134118-Pyramimonas_sp.AAC.1